MARYVANNLKARALEPLGVKVVADISTDQSQVDFSAAVLKAKQSNADAVFVYTNEEEAARALREPRKQGVGKVDRKLVAQALHGLSVLAAQQPGVLPDRGAQRQAGSQGNPVCPRRQVAATTP